MNILHITTYLQGGAGKVICDLAIHQKKLGHMVTIVTTKRDEIGYCNYPEYINRLNQEGIDIEMVDSTFKRDYALNFEAISLVTMLIRKNNIEMIHTHAAIPSMIGLIAKCANKGDNIPIIQTMHGWGTNKRAEHEIVDVQLLNAI
ncbi:MAG: glycosyltransferase family 4 protein, partial [Clostridium sp.]|nr:glycosyltransferase family 4 protein [Clostridium sp.]